MTYKQQIDERGRPTGFRDTDTGDTISVKEYNRRMAMQAMQAPGMYSSSPPLVAVPPEGNGNIVGGVMYPGNQATTGYLYPVGPGAGVAADQSSVPMQGMPMQCMPGTMPGGMPMQVPGGMPMQVQGGMPMQGMQGGMPGGGSPLIQQGANILPQQQSNNAPGLPQAPSGQPLQESPQGAGTPMASEAEPGARAPMRKSKSLRLETVQGGHSGTSQLDHSDKSHRSHGFLDATSIAILLPTLVLLALIIAAAHKKRLFPWQTIRTFNPPSGMMTPRDYERSYLCPPNLRRHGRMGKRNPEATWSEEDGVVVPFGFLARTHLPITIPMGRLPNKNMFIVAPSGSGKTTLMRAIIKSLLAKPCVIIALEAKANDPNLDEKREGFKYSVLPEAQHAGFACLYFNPLDEDSVHWNPLDLPPITFASSIVQDVNSLDAEEQHWAERDMGYIEGLVQLLKWGAVQVIGEDENGQASELELVPCNPRGLMKLVNNRRNIVESLRQLKNNPEVNATELSELTQRLSSIIRTDADWDKNIQGVRGRLRMFKNPHILRVTEHSSIDMNKAMHEPTVLIFGAPASLGPDAESLAGTFVYQLQQALHTRYGTASVLPLFAFFDEYQTLNIDLAGRLSAIVRGANGGLTVILQNISQIATAGGNTATAESELKTIFSNAAVRVCLHNADETTAKFFSEEVGKHAVIVPGIADHYQSTGFGIFPSSWNRIHSQQVVARVDSDTIKRMEKHHALVYLAPAGDPEFGETKPFMVDLRGIEEIARLHLLHNVSVRRPSGGVPDGPGAPPKHPGPGVPGFGVPTNGMPGAMIPGGGVPGGVIPGDSGVPSRPPGARPGFMHVQDPADAINNAFTGETAANSARPSVRERMSAPNLSSPQLIGQLAQKASEGIQNLIGHFFGRPRPETAQQVDAGADAHGRGPDSFVGVPQGAAEMAMVGDLMRQTGGAFGASAPQVPPAQAQVPGFAHTPFSADYDQLSSLQEASRMAAQSMVAETPAAGQAGFGQAASAIVGATAAATAAAAASVAAGATELARSCPHCGKKAGKGKFCIECGQFIGASQPTQTVGAAPSQSVPASQSSAPNVMPENICGAPMNPMANPMYNPAQSTEVAGAQLAPETPQVVGPLGSRPSANKPQPRYGGLAVTPRESMPSKRSNMVESAQQMVGTNPYQAQSAVDPRLAQGTGGIPGAGPLSQRIAMEREQQPQPANPYQHQRNQRTPVKSLNPDVSRFGFSQQSNSGVEF